MSFAVLALLAVVVPSNAAETPTPSQWITRVLDAIQDPRIYQTDPRPVLQPIGVAIVEKKYCQRVFAVTADHPDYLIDAYGFMLGPLTDCTNQRLGLLTLVVRASHIPAAEMARRISDRLGIVPSHGDAGPNTILHWQRDPTSAVEVVTSSLPEDADIVSINIAHVATTH